MRGCVPGKNRWGTCSRTPPDLKTACSRAGANGNARTGNHTECYRAGGRRHTKAKPASRTPPQPPTGTATPNAHPPHGATTQAGRPKTPERPAGSMQTRQGHIAQDNGTFNTRATAHVFGLHRAAGARSTAAAVLQRPWDSNQPVTVPQQRAPHRCCCWSTTSCCWSRQRSTDAESVEH